jgi:hypothetical protein
MAVHQIKNNFTLIQCNILLHQKQELSVEQRDRLFSVLGCNIRAWIMLQFNPSKSMLELWALDSYILLCFQSSV